MCGNASRCIAHYAVAHKIAPKNHSFLSGAGAIKVRVARDMVEVNLGKVRILKENIVEFMPNYLKNNNPNSSIVSEKSGLRSCEIGDRTDSPSTKQTISLPDLSPQDEFGLDFSLLDSGVPHLVTFVSDKTKSELAKNLAFLKTLRDKYNANVNLAVITDKSTIELLTFERGVENITLACGTGMCAVYFLAKSQNLIADKATLIPPSGDKIALRLENDEVCFKGKVAKIADIII